MCMSDYLDKPLQTLEDGLLSLGADQSIDLAAVFYDQEGRNTLNAKTGGGHGIGVDIEFADKGFTRELSSKLLNDRCDHSAWSAPRGPEIEQNREGR